MESVCGLFVLRSELKTAIYFDMLNLHILNYDEVWELAFFLFSLVGDGVIGYATMEASNFLNIFGITSINLVNFGAEIQLEMRDEIVKLFRFVKDFIPRKCNCGCVSLPPLKSYRKT